MFVLPTKFTLNKSRGIFMLFKNFIILNLDTKNY